MAKRAFISAYATAIHAESGWTTVTLSDLKTDDNNPGLGTSGAGWDGNLVDMDELYDFATGERVDIPSVAVVTSFRAVLKYISGVANPSPPPDAIAVPCKIQLRDNTGLIGLSQGLGGTTDGEKATKIIGSLGDDHDLWGAYYPALYLSASIVNHANFGFRYYHTGGPFADPMVSLLYYLEFIIQILLPNYFTYISPGRSTKDRAIAGSIKTITWKKEAVAGTLLTIELSRRIVSSSDLTTAFTSTTVTDSTAWDLSVVAAAIADGDTIFAVEHGEVRRVGLVSTVDDGNDQVTVVGWIGGTPNDGTLIDIEYFKSESTSTAATTTYDGTTAVDSTAWDLAALETAFDAGVVMYIVADGSFALITDVDDATDTVSVGSWIGGTPANGETAEIFTIEELATGVTAADESYDWNVALDSVITDDGSGSNGGGSSDGYVIRLVDEDTGGSNEGEYLFSVYAPSGDRSAILVSQERTARLLS